MSLLEVDITVERGGAYAFATDAMVTGVFGRSGAGKTTLLHALAGLVPARGRIAVGGRTLLDTDRGVGVAPEARGIGIVFQDDRLFPHRTVRGNLRYGMRTDDRRRLEDVAALLEIDALLDRAPGTLSGGERRRVAIARTILAQPRLLLLDEPLVSLDAPARAQVLELLGRLDEVLDIPTLHVSHDAAELLRHAGSLLVIDAGRSIAHGAMHALAEHPEAWALLRAFGALNVLPATVARHDADGGLTHYALQTAEACVTECAGPLEPARQAPRQPRTGGEDARTLAIGTRDIALARRRLDGVSIRNQLPGRILRLVHHADHALVEIDLGLPVLVEVSHQTVRSMDLAAGQDVVCLVKSNAVRVM